MIEFLELFIGSDNKEVIVGNPRKEGFTGSR